MAEAKRNPATEETITLTLSVDEATFLSAVLDRVGGSPTNSPRRYAPPIINALVSAGVEPMRASANGSIRFHDETPTPETFEYEGQTLKYGALYRDSDGDETEFRRGGPTGTEFRWRNPGRDWYEWVSLSDGCPPYTEITDATFEFRGQTLKYGALYRDGVGLVTEFRPGGPAGTEFRWQDDDDGEWSGWESLRSGYAPYREIDAPAVEAVNVYGREFKADTVYRDTHGCRIKFRNGADGPEWNVGLYGWEAITADEIWSSAPYREES